MNRLVTLAVIGLLMLFVALPVGLVLIGAVTHPNMTFTTFYLTETLTNPLYRLGLLTALQVAAITTTLAFLLALPLAYLGWRYRWRGQGLWEALLLTPLVLPPFVGALGVFQILGHYGVVSVLGVHLGLWEFANAPDLLGNHRLLTVCIIEALGLFPVLYLALAASLGRLDPALVESAAIAGAGPWVRFRRIILPLLRPGAFAGGSVVFIWSLTELGTPLMLGLDRIAPVQVFNGLQDLQGNRLPLALALILLVLAAAAFVLGRLTLGRDIPAGSSRGSAASAARPLFGVHAWLVSLPFAVVAGLAALPHLAVVLIGAAGDWYQTLLPARLTTDHYHAALAHAAVVPGIINSLTFASLATLLAVALGTVIAWLSVRGHTRLAPIAETLAMIPLAVPGLIMAFGFLALALVAGLAVPALRPWLDPQANPTLLLVIAYAVRRLPHAVRAVHAGLAQSPPALEEAAAACGAGPVTRLRRITLPLIAGSLAAAALLTFSFSMLEVSDSLVLAQQRAAWPIARVIFDLVGVLGAGPAIACAFATWAMLFLTATLAAAAVFLGKGPRALFR